MKTFQRFKQRILEQLFEQNDFLFLDKVIDAVVLHPHREKLLRLIEKYSFIVTSQKNVENSDVEAAIACDKVRIELESFMDDFSEDNMQEGWLNSDLLTQLVGDGDRQGLSLRQGLGHVDSEDDSRNGSLEADSSAEVIEQQGGIERMYLESFIAPKQDDKVIEFAELKEKLSNELIVEENWNLPYIVIREIIKGNWFSDFVILKIRWEDFVKRGIRGLFQASEEILERNRIKYGIKSHFESFSEECLKENWQECDSVKILFSGFTETSPLGQDELTEELHVLKEIKAHLAEIVLPPKDADQGLLEERQRHEYRQLMVRAQDEIGAGEFEAAYKHSLSAYEIYGLSPQVYEYLMLSFLRKEQASKIVEAALLGEDRLFRRLQSWAMKLKELHSKNTTSADKLVKGKEKAKKSTYMMSLQNTVDELLWSLKRQYHLIGPTNSEKEGEYRKRVKVVFNFALRVYDIAPSQVLLHTLAIELIGAGKLEWVDIDSKKFMLVNKSNLDVKSFWEKLIQIEDAVAKQRQVGKVEKGIQDSVFEELWKKQCDKNRYNPKDKPLDKIKKRENIVKILKASKTAYLLTEKEDFIEKAIKELEWLDDGTSKFKWIYLNDEGKLEAHFACREMKINYSPLDEIKFMFLKWRGAARLEEYLHELAVRICQDDLEYYKEVYEKLARQKSFGGNKIFLDEDKARRDILNCVKTWRLYGKLNNDKSSLEKALKELAGESMLTWFDVNKNGEIVSINDVGQRKELEEVLQLKQYKGVFTVESFVAEAVFRRLHAEYELLPLRQNNEGSGQLHVLAGILRKCYSCYLAAPNPEYLRFIQDELESCRKFQWFDQVYIPYHHLNFTNSNCLAPSIEYDAWGELEQIKQKN